MTTELIAAAKDVAKSLAYVLKKASCSVVWYMNDMTIIRNKMTEKTAPRTRQSWNEIVLGDDSFDFVMVDAWKTTIMVKYW